MFQVLDRVPRIPLPLALGLLWGIAGAAFRVGAAPLEALPEALEARIGKGTPILVMYTAPWSEAGRAVVQTAAQVLGERPEVGLFVINIQKYPDFAVQQGARTVPAYQVFDAQGDPGPMAFGVFSERGLRRWLDGEPEEAEVEWQASSKKTIDMGGEESPRRRRGIRFPKLNMPKLPRIRFPKPPRLRLPRLGRRSRKSAPPVVAKPVTQVAASVETKPAVSAPAVSSSTVQAEEERLALLREKAKAAARQKAERKARLSKIFDKEKQEPSKATDRSLATSADRLIRETFRDLDRAGTEEKDELQLPDSKEASRLQNPSRMLLKAQEALRGASASKLTGEDSADALQGAPDRTGISEVQVDAFAQAIARQAEKSFALRRPLALGGLGTLQGRNGTVDFSPSDALLKALAQEKGEWAGDALDRKLAERLSEDLGAGPSKSEAFVSDMNTRIVGLLADKRMVHVAHLGTFTKAPTLKRVEGKLTRVTSVQFQPDPALESVGKRLGF